MTKIKPKLIMPINYKNYPANWKTEIRPAILERANSCCEKCGVENYAVGYRDTKGDFNTTSVSIFGEDMSMISNSNAENAVADGHKIIKIVLTIAHIDHDTKNNDYNNLQALCQRCHNRLDVHDRVKNRKETQRTKSKQFSIF